MSTAAKPSITVKITGHRIDKDKLFGPYKAQNQIRNFANAFSAALAEEVGVFVGAYIRSGEWWISRSSRFVKYRAWVKLRYGSDRNRKAGGSKRSAMNKNSRVNLDETDMNQWGNIQHLMAQWLIKKLKEVSVVSQGSKGPPRVYITGLTTKSTHLDITQALNYMERTFAKTPNATGYMSRDRSRVVTAREHRMEMLEKIITGGSANLIKLRESRYGQRLWQRAEREVIKEMREKEAHKHQAPKSKREAKRHNIGGQFKWGYQTGTLAEAWTVPVWKKTVNGTKIRINLMPQNSGSGNINNWYLTQILQAKIRKQGGQGRLIPAQRVKSVIRKALNTTIAEGEMRGLSIRLKKGN